MYNIYCETQKFLNPLELAKISQEQKKINFLEKIIKDLQFKLRFKENRKIENFD